jgi:hypothetical protein
MDCMALSMPLTTPAMLAVTLRMVTAVWTREATPSILDESRSRLSSSDFLRIAFSE